MAKQPPQTFSVTPEHAQKTLAALLRVWLPGHSWSQVRHLIDTRRVQVNGEIWLDDARRLKPGESVTVLPFGRPAPELIDQIPIRHVDDDVVVVEKPAGISTVRHPSERAWLEERRLKVLTLDDLVLRQLGYALPRQKHDPKPRLRIVHRLDKETSGLVVFARTVDAERNLGLQFRKHVVMRRYLTLVPGRVETQTIRSMLLRDRGDGKRGSGDLANQGKAAITHVEVAERYRDFTLLSCRLETGRTHQIRIHLSELGHPVWGEKVYRAGKEPDASGLTRLFLHAVELGFQHPRTLEPMHWEMPLPPELRAVLEKLEPIRS